MQTLEFVELQRSLAQMRQQVESLRSRHGNVTAVRRLANDIDRLAIDADECAELDAIPRPRHEQGRPGDVVVVSDAPYDDSLWHEADDEGVGGRRGR
jgi:hypothetical protein